MHASAVALAVLLMALHLAWHAVRGLTFDLPHRERTCFYQDFEAGERYIVEYNVIRGGKLDVDVSISNPRGIILYKMKKGRQDTISFKTEEGKHSFCFSNKFSTVTDKLVNFDMRSETIELQATKLGNTRNQVNTKSEEYLERVFRNCYMTFHHQKRSRLYEARSRFAAEDLNGRVQWWSLAQALVVLGAGIGQVLVLKTFFTERQAFKA